MRCGTVRLRRGQRALNRLQRLLARSLLRLRIWCSDSLGVEALSAAWLDTLLEGMHGVS